VFRSLTLLGKRRNLRKIFIDTFGQETAHRWYLKYRQLRMGENRSRPSSASPVEPRIANADPRQWLKASPLTALADRYLGYRIYRYEFKYFAVPDTAPEFDYQRFISGTYPVSPLIALSLSDAKRLIDSSTTPTKARTALFKVFPDSRVHTDIVICARDTGPAVPASPNHILVNAQDLLSWARMASAIEIEALQSDFGTRAIDTSIIPWRFPDSWQDNSLEVVAGQLAPNIEIVQMTGSSRVYSGEDKHRLLYNKAYLSSMFQVIPSPAGKKVLEVGCSDGLVCDIFNQLGATEIHGIDVMATVGCGFRDSGIIYRSMDAAQLSFDAQSFDICCSIATLEHVPDPYKVLIEMLRVTRIGGYVYVQAAPLYHSPFGHHMFGYFQDIPWIHLRMTPNQIISLAKMRGIDKTIEGDHCLAVEEYIHEMLSPDHVNGLLLHDYRLDEFSRRSDIRILKLDYSEEGDNLLTQQILSEVRDVSRSDLTAHGFEIAFQRLS
jgi:SAM-dependent methyltransferase